MMVPAPRCHRQETLLRLGGPGRALPASSEMEGAPPLGRRWGSTVRSAGANGLMGRRKAQWEGSWKLGFSFVSKTPMLFGAEGTGEGSLQGKEDKAKM